MQRRVSILVKVLSQLDDSVSIYSNTAIPTESLEESRAKHSRARFGLAGYTFSMPAGSQRFIQRWLEI